MITNVLRVTAPNTFAAILEVESASIERTTRESHQYGSTDRHTLDDAPILIFSYGGGFYITHLNSIHFCSHIVRVDEKTRMSSIPAYIRPDPGSDPRLLIWQQVLHGLANAPAPASTIYHNLSPFASLATTSSTRVSNSLAQLRTCAMRCNGLSITYPSPILTSTSSAARWGR